MPPPVHSLAHHLQLLPRIAQQSIPSKHLQLELGGGIYGEMDKLTQQMGDGHHPGSYASYGVVLIHERIGFKVNCLQLVI